MFPIKCPLCGALSSSQGEMLGKEVTCPECQEVFVCDPSLIVGNADAAPVRLPEASGAVSRTETILVLMLGGIVGGFFGLAMGLISNHLVPHARGAGFHGQEFRWLAFALWGGSIGATVGMFAVGVRMLARSLFRHRSTRNSGSSCTTSARQNGPRRARPCRSSRRRQPARAAARSA